MRIKTLIQRLLGINEDSSLEYRLFLSAMLIGAGLSFIGAVVSILIYFEDAVIIITNGGIDGSNLMVDFVALVLALTIVPANRRINYSS